MKLSQKYYLQFLENAYFVISISSKKVLDLAISLRDVQQLKNFLMTQKHIDKDLFQPMLLEINQSIKSHQGQYIWAFKSIEDIVKTIFFKDSPNFKPYSMPQNGIEKSIDDLYHRFSMSKDSNIDILAISGEEVFIDPRFRSGLSASSVMNEVPSLIPSKLWTLSTGYQKGISLVKIKEDATCYRFSFQLVKEIIKKSGNLHLDHNIFMDESKIIKYLAQQMNENIKDTHELVM